MILYLLLFLNIVTANNCIKIGEFSYNIIYACPIQLLNPPSPAPATHSPVTPAPPAPALEPSGGPGVSPAPAPVTPPPVTLSPEIPETPETPSPVTSENPVIPTTPPPPTPPPTPTTPTTPPPTPTTPPPTPQAPSPVTSEKPVIDEVVYNPIINKNITNQTSNKTNTQNNTNKIIENYTGIIISSIAIVILIILIILFFIRRRGAKNKICDSPKNDIEKQFVGDASSSTEETIAITSGTIEQSNRPLPRTYRMPNVLESKIPTAKPLTIPVKKPARPPRTSPPRTQPPKKPPLPPLPKKAIPPDHPPIGFSDTMVDMPEKSDVPEKIESKESEIYEDDFE